MRRDLILMDQSDGYLYYWKLEDLDEKFFSLDSNFSFSAIIFGKNFEKKKMDVLLHYTHTHTHSLEEFPRNCDSKNTTTIITITIITTATATITITITTVAYLRRVCFSYYDDGEISFLQDAATCHISRETKKFLKDHKI